LADLLGGFTVVRTFNLGEWILERFDRSNRSLLNAEMHRVRLESALAAANNLGGSSFFISFGVGAYMVLNGMTTFGSMFALVQLNNQIQFFVFSLGGTITRIQAALAAADRILNVLDTPQEFDRYQPIAEKTIDDPDPEALLEFQQVRFRYDDSKEVLQGLTFSVKQNQVAAIVGPSGSGKSTIFKLLLGCYPIRHGSLLLDGKSINVLSLPELRDQFAYIPQDAYLYSGTIRDNIRFGKPDASNDEITTAAKAAYAHDFITGFKDGYNTRVGERGARLSGGQRQRIAIARALLKDARILLLDEATSALDSESEELVQRALHVLMKRRTVLVIAHRLSTIENADIIYTVDGGRLVESGDHQTLMAQDGLYKHLHELQFQGDEIPA
jgi:ABC-type multidrug transport system fused ATPase/permease subunit